MTQDTRLEALAEELTRRMGQVMKAAMASAQVPLPDLALAPREVNTMVHLAERETIMTELATATAVPLSTLTRIVDRLERKGLVERSRSDLDRRIVMVKASEKGRQMNHAMHEHHMALSRRMLEPLSAEERELLVALMTKLAKEYSRPSA